MSALSKKSELWDSIWDGGEAHPWRHPHFEVVRETISSLGLRLGRVLEVGSGAGGMQSVADDYTGIDISFGAARYLRSPAKFVCCSVSSMPFDDGAFDFVFTIFVLEHVTEIE